MLLPPTENLVVAKYAPGAGYAPRQWADALARVDWDRAELLSDKPRSSVWRVRLSLQGVEREVVVKCEPIDTLKRKLQKALRKTHAFRHWRGAELLHKHRLKTAKPWAIVYGRAAGVEIECLLMESLPGKTVLRHLADGDLRVREEHAVGWACGKLAWDLESTAPNPDLKLSNLIVLDPSPPRASLAMIDCVGVGRRADHIQMLAIQLIEARGVGLSPRRALLMRALLSCIDPGPKGKRRRHRVIDGWWCSVQAIVERQGNAAPLHDPLATPVRRVSGEPSADA